MLRGELGAHMRKAVPDWTVLVVPHDDGRGFFCVYRPSPTKHQIHVRGAGLHLRAATELARALRDEGIS